MPADSPTPTEREAALEAAKEAVLGELDLWDVPNYVHPSAMNWERFAEHVVDSMLDAVGFDALVAENAWLRSALTRTAQCSRIWQGQHVNDAPSRAELIERARVALSEEGETDD